MASLALHAGGIGLALTVPGSVFQDPGVDLRRDLLAKQENPEKRRIIIWYRKGERLPIVDSGEEQAAKLPEAKHERGEIVFTKPKPEAPKKQFIFTDLPKVAVQPELPAPNVVSFAAPAVPTLPPPRPEPRKFQAPPAKPRAPAPLADLAEGIPDETSSKMEIPVATPVVAAIDPRLMRAPAKKFVLPNGERAGRGGEPKPLMDAPAAPAEGTGGTGATAGTGTMTMAIISRYPTNMPQPPEIRGNRPDAVQIGGIAGGAKNGGEGGRGGDMIPGLTVRGDRSGESPAAVAPVASPKPAESAGAVPTRPPALAPAPPVTVSIPQWPNSRRVPATVESVFRDRPVFATVVTPPNGLPDWVMWFGDTGPTAPGVRVFMRPPVPRQLSWAAGGGAGNGWPEKAWIKARLTKEGALTSIIVSEGAEPAAATTIAQMLGRWLFSPAIRNGEVIDADVLLEVSFGRAR